MEIRSTEITVAELVVEDYRKAEVFKKFGIDFCCGGKISVAEVCEQKNVDFEVVTNALDELDNQKEKPSQDFNNWELDFLVDYIVNTHHKYVIESIPILDAYSSKVASVHGTTHPEVVEIANLYRAVSEELSMHMHKEEAILFPIVKEIVRASRNNETLQPTPFGTIKNPINMMETEHDSAGRSFEAIRDLSNNYTPPESACNTYRVLFAKLEEFENDLHQHIHLENNILFPKAIKLEADHS